ncbi:MAG: protein kinase family protein [Candidatus Xenobia bacterium]
MDPLSLRGCVINRRYRLGTETGGAWSAFDLESARPVSMWLWPANGPRSAAVAQHLNVLTKLSHPGLLEVRAVGEVVSGAAAGMTFIVTEAVDGTLTRLEPDEAVRMARDIAGALQYLHEARLAHRHLTPHCIYRVGDRWKLGGTGTVDRGVRAAWEASPDPRFLAPDLLLGRVAPPADMWAFGGLVLHALTGQAPVSQPVVRALATHRGTPLDRLPPPFDLVVPGCLRWEAERRWDAADVLAVLDGGLAPPEEPRLARGAQRPRSVKVWPTRPERRLLGHRSPITALAWEGDRLLSGDEEGTARLWDTASDTCLQVWEEHWRCRPGPASIEAVAVRPDGRVAVGSAVGLVRAWDSLGERTLERDARGVRAVFWKGWEVEFVTDMALRWAASHSAVGTLDGLVNHQQVCDGAILSLAEHGKRLAWGSASGLIGVGNSTFQASSAVLQVLLSRQHVAAVTADRSILLLRVPDLTWTHELEAPAWCAAFSPDGRQLAAGLTDGSIRIWPLPH